MATQDRSALAHSNKMRSSQSVARSNRPTARRAIVAKITEIAFSRSPSRGPHSFVCPKFTCAQPFFLFCTFFFANFNRCHDNHFCILHAHNHLSLVCSFCLPTTFFLWSHHHQHKHFRTLVFVYLHPTRLFDSPRA